MADEEHAAQFIGADPFDAIEGFEAFFVSMLAGVEFLSSPDTQVIFID